MVASTENPLPEYKAAEVLSNWTSILVEDCLR